MSNRQPAWLQRLRRIRWPLRPGRPRRPCRHSNPADQGCSSRVALGDQAGQELGLVLQVVNVRLW